MGKVIDFRVLRIQNELDKYEKDKVIPGIILEGYYTIEDIFEKFYPKLSKKHRKIAEKLKAEYIHSLEENRQELRDALRADYAYTMAKLRTTHESFRLPEVMKKHRASINPVKALYYEAREIFRGYNADNYVHQLIADVITDPEYNNIILNALERDIASLEKIIKRYYIPLTQYSKDIPLELFHARQTINDFKHYLKTFKEARSWRPDE